MPRDFSLLILRFLARDGEELTIVANFDLAGVLLMLHARQGPLLQESKIDVIFALHVVEIPQLEQVVLDEIELEVISRRIGELRYGDGAEALVHRSDDSHRVTGQKEYFALLPILGEHLEVFDAFPKLRNLDVIDIAYQKLEVDLPPILFLDFFALFPLLL